MMMAKARTGIEPAHGEHPRPPRPHPDDMMQDLIDSQARVITAQAAVIRFYADLVSRMHPDHEPNGGD